MIAVTNANLIRKIPNNYEQFLGLCMKERNMTEEDLVYTSGLSMRTIIKKNMVV